MAPANDNTRRLTKGQRGFFRAVAIGEHGVFHRSVIEPIEGLPFGQPDGLVTWIGGLRLAGCNGFAPFEFALTEEGERLARELGFRPAPKPPIDLFQPSLL